MSRLREENLAPMSPAPDTDGPVRLSAWVHGRVQGVGFRWWVRRHAEELGIVGWVMNADDERSLELVAEGDDAALTETVAQTSRLVADLQDEIMTSRMVPVWQVFDRFPRLVRDAAHGLGKQVNFTIEGKEIELDR